MDAATRRCAISHTAWNTIANLRRENGAYIERDMCPPNSLDLNPWTALFGGGGFAGASLYHSRKSDTVDQLYTVSRNDTHCFYIRRPSATPTT